MQSKATLTYAPSRLGNMDTNLKVVAFKQVGQARSTKADTVDISALTEESLRNWLSEGGDNPRAENVIGVMLGHGRLHPIQAETERRFAWNVEGPARQHVMEFIKAAMLFGSLKKDSDKEDMFLKSMDFQFMLGWLKGSVDITPAMLQKASDGNAPNKV